MFKKCLPIILISSLVGAVWLLVWETRAELIFKEARQWQIASDTVANLILLWDPADGDIPTDWTCISSSGQDFYQRFIRGNSTYGTEGGGAATHTHPDPGTLTSVAAPGYGSTSVGAPAYPALANHTHTTTVNSGLSGNNIPEYRNLRVIRYNNGIPSSLPQNIIAIFDDTPPLGWTTTGYNDGKYIQGEDTSGTGGSNTHTHTITLNTTSAAAAQSTSRSNKAGFSLGGDQHTHPGGSNTTAEQNHEPPYMTVILAKKDSAGSIPANMIGMFNDTPPAANWTVNSGSGQAFYTRFFKPTGSYGTSSDVKTHTHSDLTVTTDVTSSTHITNDDAGAMFTAGGHTHNFTVSFGAAVNHEPPYWDAIFAKAGTTPTPDLKQIHYHWRNDDGDEVNASSATGGSQDNVYDSFPSTSNKRLRLEISNEGGAAAQDITFRIDYALKGAGCGSASYTDVGAVGGDWDMAADSQLVEENDTTNIEVSTGGVADAPLPSNFKTPNSAQKETSSLVAATTLTYEDFIEMEFSIKPNVSSGDYCFRVSNNGDTTNFDYQKYAEATVVAVSLSFAVDSASLDFETLTPSTPITDKTSTLTVTTDSADGFIIKVARNTGNTTLDLAADDSFDITDHTAWNATTPNSTIITLGDDFLAFRVASADTDSGNYNSTWWGDGDTLGSDAKYAGFPTPSETIVNRTSASDPSTDSVIRYYIDVANTQKIGTYDGGVTYTATAN